MSGIKIIIFLQKFHFNDKLIIGLLVGELRSMWALFLGNAERHIKILIFKLFKKIRFEYFCRLLYIKISSCLPVGIMEFHVSVKGWCLCMNRQLFIQVIHLLSHLLKQQSVDLLCCLLRYWATHIHIKKLLANGKRRKKLIYLELCAFGENK